MGAKTMDRIWDDTDGTHLANIDPVTGEVLRAADGCLIATARGDDVYGLDGAWICFLAPSVWGRSCPRSVQEAAAPG